MHDNPQAPFALPDHRLIALSGRDAAVFAQAQFMSDISTLAPGSWQWSGWLTSKGRVIALFALLKLSDESIWLLLPDADPGALAAALQRYVFRSKVKIAVRDDLRVEGCFAAPVRARGNAIAGDELTGIELDIGSAEHPRSLRIGRDLASIDDADAVCRWQAFDLEHALPRLPASQVEHWTPQQLSLERLQAFSVKKGCYPGQEIVARTHFLGQAKRGLVLLEGDEPLAAGTEVQGESTTLGKVVASASCDGRHLALAVVPLEREPQAIHVGGTVMRERPLLSGLAR